MSISCHHTVTPLQMGFSPSILSYKKGSTAWNMNYSKILNLSLYLSKEKSTVSDLIASHHSYLYDLAFVHWLWSPTMDYVILGMPCHIQGFEKPWVLFLVDFACILQLKKWKELNLGLKLAHLRTLKHYVDHSWITILISFCFCLLFELSLSSSHKPLCSINSHLPLWYTLTWC